MVKFCVILNVFVSIALITLSSICSQGHQNRDDLSEKSKTVYDNLPNTNGKNKFFSEYMKVKEADKLENEYQYCDLKSKEAFFRFLYAAWDLKNHATIIYPQFVGEWEYDANKKRNSNPSHDHFMQNIDSEASLPLDLQSIIARFAHIERHFNAEKIFKARVKIPNFFCHMYALLTRFDAPGYKECLKNKTYDYAKNIMSKITDPSFSPDQRKKTIIDFSSRYAHIRHCFNIFKRYQTQDGITDTVTELRLEKIRRLQITTKNADETYPSVDVGWCEVLDRMSILMLWQFTEKDLVFMNIMSSIAGPYNNYNYSSFYCDFKTKNEEIVKVMIPFSQKRKLPILEV